MKNDRFAAKLAALETLRNHPKPDETFPALRKALSDRSGFIVAKAASIAAGASLTELVPDLIGAFERLLIEVDDDAGCQAKNALAKALRNLDHRSPGIFIAGLAHAQLEPVWGKKVDTAGPLRATCAHALVVCTIDTTSLLELLTDHLVDNDKIVRAEAVSAIGQVGTPSGILALRLKALCGDDEAEVLGECFVQLLDLMPSEYLPFVSRFLAAPRDDVRFEAANALAQSKIPESIDRLRDFLDMPLSYELRRAVIASLTASPVPASADLLVTLITTNRDELALTALEALAASRFARSIDEPLASAVATNGSASLRKAFEERFAARSRA